MSEWKRIKALPPEVIGQIAAGEVVERPSAAIKELVENSMDAGATAITVDIKEGGKTSFRVTDNGSGIRPEDIRMAFMRHATSKLRTAQELSSISSLGFRGEALASISAVAKVTCQTRARGLDTGISCQCVGGVIDDIRDAACPEGTSFTVKDLFYNAPVRQKFLRKASAETASVSDLMARLILSRPDISFRLTADGKNVYFSPGDGKMDSAVMSVYGISALKSLVRVSGQMNGVLLDGFVGVGDAARGNRSQESFFLNQRAIRSNLLSAAVESACHQRVMIGRFPMCVINLTMPYQSVDVNVHPNKWEVRFQDERAVAEAIESTIVQALDARDMVSTAPPLFVTQAPARASVTIDSAMPPVNQMPISPHTPAVITRQNPERLRDPGVSLLTPKPVVMPPLVPEKPTKEKMPPEQEKKPPEQITDKAVEAEISKRSMRVIGVLFDTYILLECDDQLLLCDQHAMHERLLYEKFMREAAAGGASQALLTPQIVRLTRAQYQAYEDHPQALAQAGFDLSPFGDGEVQLRGVPLILGVPRAESCLIDALDELSEAASLSDIERMRRVIQTACKHAVKGGERLPDHAVTALVHDILDQKTKPTCPHGRPLMISVTKTDLEKRFKRIQG